MPSPARSWTRKKYSTPVNLIVVGTSLGGFNALEQVFSPIPADFCVPVVVVQHRHRTSTAALARFVENNIQMPVYDAEDGQPLDRGGVYLAPADYHVLIEEGAIRLSLEGPVNYSRPSIDLLFETAAEEYGESLVAVVLTGANNDGAAGAAAVKANGGTVVVQEPETAEAPEMPRAAIRASKVDYILPLEEVSRFLLHRCGIETK